MGTIYVVAYKLVPYKIISNVYAQWAYGLVLTEHQWNEIGDCQIAQIEVSDGLHVTETEHHQNGDQIAD